jgi:hypothetical protein
MEDDHMSFDKIIWAVHNQTKINTGEIFEKYKISPKAQGMYGCSIVQDDSHVGCEACSQDWYFEDGASLSHGI